MPTCWRGRCSAPGVSGARQPGADPDRADRRRGPAGLPFRRHAGVRRGAAALHGLLLATRRAGVIVQVGNLPDVTRPVNLAPLVSKEIQLRGTFRFNTEIDDRHHPARPQPANRAGDHSRTADRGRRPGIRDRRKRRHLRQSPGRSQRLLTEIPGSHTSRPTQVAPHIRGVSCQFVVYRQPFIVRMGRRPVGDAWSVRPRRLASRDRERL